MTADSYLARLSARSEAVGSPLCLGVDPSPDALPAGFARSLEGVARFAELLIEVALPHAAAVKANLAFFEAYGSPGLAVLERLRAQLPADVPFIADAKRGDIGSTAERLAVALCDSLGAEAVTVNPYLGRDALEPLLERDECFVYVLCRTSNPGAGEFQELEVDGEPLYVRVARSVGRWSDERQSLGLVVGATAAEEMSVVRSAVPQLPFLVPGVGAQGGDIDAVLREGPARAGRAGSLAGGGLLVNVSRGIALAARDSRDASAGIAQAAGDWSRRLSVRMVRQP